MLASNVEIVFEDAATGRPFASTSGVRLLVANFEAYTIRLTFGQPPPEPPRT